MSQNHSAVFKAESLKQWDYLKSINADYIDELYGRFLQDPESVDPTWRYFFEGVALGQSLEIGVTPAGESATKPHPAANLASTTSAPNTPPASIEALAKALNLHKFREAFKTHGHLAAKLNPLEDSTPALAKALQPATYGLTDADLAPHRADIDRLKQIYCGTVGVETLHLQDKTERDFVTEQLEKLMTGQHLSPEDKKFILSRLTDAESLERFLHTRYVAQKRFSIEGGEVLIPVFDRLIETLANHGTEEVVIGMAHRGRLNTLVNILKKPAEKLFTEFDDNYPLSTEHGEGDVKYHKGHSHDFVTRGGKPVHLSMAFNPSHLEFVNPVVAGMARAKQVQRQDHQKTKVVPIVVHGDAAFAGQGVVYETLQASQLESYGVGGTLHIVSNNQVGFTTDPTDSRSTRYCTDLARMLDAPIFHVNGNDPETAWKVATLCAEYRQLYKKDVVIDLVCYRKYGHNEGDEPSFTQPLTYKNISARKSPRETYADQLASQGVIAADFGKTLFDQTVAAYTPALEKVRAEKPEPHTSEYEGRHWSQFRSATREDIEAIIPTGVAKTHLQELAQKINHFPQGFTIHPKLERLFESRRQAFLVGQGIDWGNAEVMAYATLVDQGVSVRMSGQDVQRGTFTHRHAVVTDVNTGLDHCAINGLTDAAKLHIFNSHLSETAAMGFEYGYALTDPASLVIWEAQFGDFANGAQVIIDQFMATSESKWHRANGLVLFLPHGYEGQGPEHSSARLERFLQLCGRDNMTVAYPSTPAQMFHLLRRQVLRPFRKPLVVMTPKSLLRHPKAVATLDQLSQEHFHEILDDPAYDQPQKVGGVSRIILCTGKVYYDLIEEREKLGAHHVAVIRLEQIHPWPEFQLTKILAKYLTAKEIVFVQEEPRNMGAWSFVHGMWSGGIDHFGSKTPWPTLYYIGRDVCASPAVGSKKLHDHEQREMISKALKGTL